jgi:hypothetical protein
MLGVLTALTLVTALTGLTADIVDEIDLIGWVTSLAICSSALAANNVILVNPVRCQHSQSCQTVNTVQSLPPSGGVATAPRATNSDQIQCNQAAKTPAHRADPIGRYQSSLSHWLRPL